MRFLSECLKDAEGYYSWTRVSASISLFMAVGLSVFQVVTGTDQYTLITTWLGFAFGGKVTQKFAESLNTHTPPSGSSPS